jgi:hypothetical protein
MKVVLTIEITSMLMLTNQVHQWFGGLQQNRNIIGCKKVLLNYYALLAERKLFGDDCLYNALHKARYSVNAEKKIYNTVYTEK